MASTQPSPRPQKRDHDTFEGIQSKDSSDRTNSPHPQPQATMREDSSDLSDVGPNTPSDIANSPMVAAVAGPSNTISPSAFTALNGNPPPPAKKTKLTFAEKEEMKLLKEAEKSKKAEKDKVNAEEKARKAAEKEAERKEKEAERKLKEAELEKKRAATAEKKRKREEEKKKKEDEKKKVEEEKLKKERSQKKLSNFFAVPGTANRRGSMDSGGRTSMSPAPQTSNLSILEATTSVGNTPRKPVLSHYEKTFHEFFIHADVRVSKVNRFERDEEGIKSTQDAIDGYLSGDRSPGRTRPFDATSLFHLPGSNSRRGKYPMPVRDIMTEFSGASSKVIDLTTDSQNSQIKRMRELLGKVPVKIIMHAEDVRPPYRGTYTSRPLRGIAKLARNPWRKELPDKNYDYDSEAEWIEDEDAEDCMSDGEEEEDVEDGEDMEGFLDDENDELANGRRTATHGNNDLEPISTGLCWEDKHKRSTNVKMMPYRMEIILDSKLKSIDPFSTSYWPSTIPTAMDPPRAPLTTKKATNVNNILQASSNASNNKSIKTLSLNPPKSGRGKDNSKPKVLLDAKDIPDFLEAVKGSSNLTKVGLIEVLKKQNPNWKGPAVKGTLETMCKRVGSKEADKRWVIVEEAGM